MNREARLVRFFHDTTHGKRPVRTAEDARLFLEGACHVPPVRVAEALMSSAGLPALATAARCDMTGRGLRGTLNLVHKLSDPAVEAMGGGQILTKIMTAIVSPPIVWRSMLDAARAVNPDRLTDTPLEALAWLAGYLVKASFHDGGLQEFVSDVEGWFRDTKVSEADPSLTPGFHSCWGKLREMLQMCATGSLLSADGTTPGGRHDNDFADFRQIATIPTAAELQCADPPFYRRWAEVEAANMAERPRAHMDNMYRLLREDMLAEIRQEMQAALDKDKGKSHRRRPVLGQLVLRGVAGPRDRHRSGARCALMVYPRQGLERLCGLSQPQRLALLKKQPGFLKHQSFMALCRGSEVISFGALMRDEDAICADEPNIGFVPADDGAFKRTLAAFTDPNGLRLLLVDAPVFAYEPVLERLKSMPEVPMAECLLDPDHRTETIPASQELVPVVERLRSMAAQGSVEIEAGPSTYSLDKAQSRSLLNALETPVTIIQGPPGTGKSLIGAIVAHHFLQTTSLKVLVLSYKNHAIDDFLNHLVRVGIPLSEMVRLGGNMSDAMREISVDSLKRAAGRKVAVAWTEVSKVRQALATMRAELESASDGFLKNAGPPLVEVLEWLEFSSEYAEYFAAFTIPTAEDGFKLAGTKGKEMKPEHLIERWISGKSAGVPGRPPKKCPPWALPVDERRRLMALWKREIQMEHIAKIADLAAECNKLRGSTAALTAEDERVIVRTKRVMASTTTAASKYQKLIEAAQPDVVIVEEAAEILEAHVVAALGPSVKRLVMIGDHKQLRPRINNFDLSVQKGDGFDLDRSLFERLILGGHDFTTLLEQHRSPPETTNLLRLLTYPDLRDAPSTLERPPVRGLQQRFVFMNHEHRENTQDAVLDRDASSPGSRQNMFEAEMVLSLVRYLAQQGYKTSEMVVLTPYLGQLYLLMDILRHETDPWLTDVDNHDLRRAGLITDAAAKAGKNPLRLSTIDNYQGEQSDIVIVSLTRSNAQGSIGFLAQPERLTVLLSRHRHGLIMIGNMDTFTSSRSGGKMWKTVFEHLRDNNFLHDGIPVVCSKHPDRQAVLMEPSHFIEKCPDGGCAEICNAPLSCGRHNCQLRCHRLEDHTKTPCDVKFEQTCERGHRNMVTCTTAPDACRDCMHENEKMRRRAERMLHAEEERLRRVEQYRNELKELEDEIECHKRELRYVREAEDHKEQIAQRRKELDAMKEARKRKKELDGKRETSAAKSKASTPASQKPAEVDSADLSAAAAEWAAMKESEGASSPAIDELMGLIGLEDVKREFLNIKEKIDLIMRQDLDPSRERFGCTFLGNPGTGKTTVARIYAKFLPSVGAISGSEFVETTGAKLASGGVPNAQKMIDDLIDAGGGVIFVDEAYQLSSGNSPGGAAVLDFLLAEVENLRGRVVFLLAGYDKEMESFFAHNPGFTSRFPTTLKFADYSDDELLSILQRNIDSRYNGSMKLEGGPDGLYARIVARRVGRGRGKPGFGNARAVENAMHQVANRQAARVRGERRAKGTSDDLFLTKEDLIGPEPGGVLQKSKAWKELQEMVGLKEVKQEIKVLMDTLYANYKRELDEKPLVEYSLNRVLVGNPGTGKTTVAKLYGRILVDLGMLSNGEVVVKNPSDFVGSVLGQSEQLTKGILASTVGKVLVLDEAYGLYDGGSGSGSVSNPYKTAVIDTIVAEVQSVPGDDRCVLLLGYRDQMEAMFQNVNPGLSRRFPMSAAFEFGDFGDVELLEILNRKLAARGFNATNEAKDVAIEVLSRARARPNFGNGGEVDILIAEAQRRHQKRQAATETFEATDIDPEHDRASRADTNVAMLFAGEVGREAIVATLTRYQAHVRTCKDLGMEPREDIPFGFLFRGPPGTGKTTTAKKMGKVFYDMGFLSECSVVECSASELVGEYIGQTAPKVKQMMDKALGRVLFIDEAYRLNDGRFGKEALDELVDCLTKDRYAKKLVVILAGYDEQINQLLRANPGLSSRFPVTLDFANLGPTDCWQLLMGELNQRKAKLEKAGRATADLSVLGYISPHVEGDILARFARLADVEGWGNARDVKTLANGVFTRIVANIKGRAVVLEVGHIFAELDAMLRERLGRASAAVAGTQYDPLPTRQPREGPPQNQVTTSISTETRTAPPEPKEEQEEPKADMEEPPHDPRWQARRDAGVSDEVWEQLQRDIAEQHRRDQEYAALHKKACDAREGAYEEIVRQLLEEKRRREEEEAKRAQLARAGKCPAGYEWVKQGGGWRCAGGSHFVSDEELSAM